MFKNKIPHYGSPELAGKLTSTTTDQIIDWCKEGRAPCKWDKKNREYKVNIKKLLKKFETY